MHSERSSHQANEAAIVLVRSIWNASIEVTAESTTNDSTLDHRSEFPPTTNNTTIGRAASRSMVSVFL